MESNFWFYTLSAIPQTLGAIIALTATFVVFKWNRIEESLNSHIYHIKIILRSIGHKKDIPKGNYPKDFLGLFKTLILSDNDEWIKDKWSLLFGAYRTIVRDPYIDVAGAASADDMRDWLNYQIKEDLRSKIQDRKIMFSYLWKTLTIVGFTIMFCLFFLPFGVEDLLGNFLKITIISFSIGLTGGSIVATAISILKIIKL